MRTEMNPALKPAPRSSGSQPARRTERLSKTFWKLAQGTGVHTQSNEPVDVVKYLLAALGGLEGKRSDSQVTADALSFLLRLEDDPRYASPEQTRGGEKDRRALVYSIGVLLFERLTGHHPFVESLSPIQAAVVRDRCGRRGANNLCSLPGELRAVLNKALSPFPEDRYDGVAEMRAALIRFVANQTLSQARASGSPPLGPRPQALAPAPPKRQKRPTPPPCPSSAERKELAGRPRPPTRASKAGAVTLPPPIPSACSRPGVAATASASTAAARPTRAANRPTPAAARPAAAVANPTSGAPTPAVAPRQRGRDATPTATCGEALAHDSLRLLSQRKVIRLVLALGMGAFLLVVATLALNWPQDATATTEAAPHTALANDPGSATGLAAEIPASQPKAPLPAENLVATADTEAAAEPEVELPPDPVAAFDPDLGAESALEAARDCFSESRLGKGVQLGVSLRYDAVDGLSNRVYHAPDHDLERAERRCISQRLVGLTAGGVPERATIVIYSLFLNREGGRHTAHISD